MGNQQGNFKLDKKNENYEHNRGEQKSNTESEENTTRGKTNSKGENSTTIYQAIEAENNTEREFNREENSTMANSTINHGMPIFKKNMGIGEC